MLFLREKQNKTNKQNNNKTISGVYPSTRATCEFFMRVFKETQLQWRLLHRTKMNRSRLKKWNLTQANPSSQNFTRHIPEKILWFHWIQSCVRVCTCACVCICVLLLLTDSHPFTVATSKTSHQTNEKPLFWEKKFEATSLSHCFPVLEQE